VKFSANLGFLWTDRPLPDAIHAAHQAGFDAVECHWPFDVSPKGVRAALAETGLPMLGLNTTRGDVAAGENGLAALPSKRGAARDAIEQAVSYAASIGAQSVHVMAGNGQGVDADQTFVSNLRDACALAEMHDLMILIEPLNRHDAPGYFLRTTDQARDIIERVGSARLKLMFDCYHVQRTEGDVITRIAEQKDIIGHIQFAAVPDRGPPDRGELNYDRVFDAVAALGWQRPLGAEYRPDGPTDGSLSWLLRYRL
jgi:hydroxypyruvate isomerase